MDIQEIASLLHIHEKASAHGSSMTHIRDLALYQLKQHNAGAKEAVDHIREEEQKEAAAKAEALAAEQPKPKALETIHEDGEPEPKSSTQPTQLDRRL